MIPNRKISYLACLLALPVVGQAEQRFSVPVERASTKNASVSSSGGVSASGGGQTTNVDSQALWDIYSQIEALQQEVGQLRGMIESQRNEIDLMRKQQRDRYLDLDRRLSMSGQKQDPDSEIENVPSSPNDSASLKAEKDAYKAAQAYVKSKDLEKAEVELKNFIKRYPKGDYAPHAYYWLGLVQMALPQPKLDDAKKNFETLLKNYPDHSKVPATMFKLGTLYDVKGDKKEAKSLLNKVITNYKGSAAAELSERYLKQMK